MPTIKPKNWTVRDVYIWWCRQKVKSDKSLILRYDYYYRAQGLRVLMRKTGDTEVVEMNYWLFRQVVETYNKLLVDDIIAGHRIDLGKDLGFIEARRKERNFNHPRVDQNATLQARKTEPDHPPIYYTNEDFSQMVWIRVNAMRNESVYSFYPATYNCKAKFSNALAADPVLKYKFPYYPYIPKGEPLVTSERREMA